MSSEKEFIDFGESGFEKNLHLSIWRISVNMLVEVNIKAVIVGVAISV